MVETLPDAAPRAAYIHVPFCRHRCGYCNFTLVAGRDDLIDRYLEALDRELSGLGRARPIDTLFLGGGTPSHLSPPKLRTLFEIAQRWFSLNHGYEFTIEANPSDITPDRVAVMREYGVTRLSLGAQSFDPGKLRVLERDHSAADIHKAIDLARPAFNSISIDLIFGVPGETLETWLADLEQALRLRIDHSSTYGLTFERGTQFWSQRLRGELREIDDDIWRQMYAAALDRLPLAGFEHYEVSNFARAGHRCRHNEVYWAAGEYFAAGPGAARHVSGRREVNHRSTTTWLDRVLAGESPVAESEMLEPADKARERLVLALRTSAGVETEQFARETGYCIRALVGQALAKHLELGTLAREGNRLKLTRAGLFVSDAIWPDFLRV